MTKQSSLLPCHSELVSESHDSDDNAIAGHLSSQARTARNDEEKPFNHSTVQPLNHPSLNKRIAFTLAEVLITLGIIGVVAAMTLPGLIQNYNRKVLKTQFTQTLSIISQTLSMVKASNQHSSIYDYYTVYDPDKKYYKKDELEKEFLKHIKKLDVKANNLTKIKYLTYDGSQEYRSSDSSYVIRNPNIALANGAMLYISIGSDIEGAKNINIGVDTNGAKKPNRLGFDRFNFRISDSSDKIIGRKMSKLYNDEELEGDIYAGAKGFPCSMKSKQASNGLGCAGFAMEDVCPDDPSKGYWECLPIN